MNRKSKILLFVGCILVLLALQRLQIADNDDLTVIDDKNINSVVDTPSTSGNWALDAIILIDGDATGVDAQNWTWVEAQEWFGGGEGTEETPYLLENMTISVDSGSAGLTIKDSAAYFELYNITITNLGGDGLELNNISNGYVLSCNFSLNGNTGLYMHNVNDTTISLTYCLNNTVDGIYAVDSNGNEFVVDCSGNGRYGLIIASSDNNTVYLSQFIENGEVGVVILEIEDHSDSVNNIIYNSYFEGNTINAVDNSTLPNSWDYEEIGNEWDDYEGVDANDDEIGDTPYDISGTAGAQDNYPYCSDGDESVVSVSSSSGGDRDLFEEVDPITLALLIGVFFGIFIATLVITKFLTKKR